MRLQGKKIAILVAEGVEDLEYYVPLMRLQEDGAQVLTAALDIKPIHGKNGLEITPDTKIEALHAQELFALILPGGWAPDKLRRYAAVKDLVRDMDSSGKMIGIICHGGLIPISAGIMKGRRATGSLGIKDDILNAGGTWASVVRTPIIVAMLGSIIPDPLAMPPTVKVPRGVSIEIA